MTFAPTKPRKRISEMPSTSDLVESNFDNPRSIHGKPSDYSFRLEQGKYEDESSTNTCYFPKPEISPTDKNVSSQNSLDAHHDDPKDDLTPGPGAYSPEGSSTMRVVYQSAPSYTFGMRHSSARYYANIQTPGPGAYSLYSNFPHKPRAPHYSFSNRHSWYKAPFIVEYKE